MLGALSARVQGSVPPRTFREQVPQGLDVRRFHQMLLEPGAQGGVAVLDAPIAGHRHELQRSAVRGIAQVTRELVPQRRCSRMWLLGCLAAGRVR